MAMGDGGDAYDGTTKQEQHREVAFGRALSLTARAVHDKSTIPVAAAANFFSAPATDAAANGNNNNNNNAMAIQFLIQTPRGRTATTSWWTREYSFDVFVSRLLDAAAERDQGYSPKRNWREQQHEQEGKNGNGWDSDDHHRYHNSEHSLLRPFKKQRLQSSSQCALQLHNCKNISSNVYLVHQGKVLDRDNFHQLWDFSPSSSSPLVAPTLQHYHQQQYLMLKFRLRGGTDRQNRVGSKFGGGGVSSAQQAERERKERLKQLALESIDLAKDPYLMRNHLGTYECKLCLTLHTNEANYLAHTQGKKHQQGLAHRAYLEKLKKEQEAVASATTPSATPQQPMQQQQLLLQHRQVKIGRPAYQVFKSRDADTHQRCLSFELHYPEIVTDLQPRHRFMSAFEQRVESPPDRRFQYLLFAAEPYETVAFKVPNEPIDRNEGRFVTHWDDDDKRFTLTLYFI